MYDRSKSVFPATYLQIPEANSCTETLWYCLILGEAYILLLCLSVNSRIVIGQFSEPYSTVQTAKI